MSIRVIMQRDFTRDGVAVFIVNESVDGQISLAQPVDLTFVKTEHGVVWPEPTLFFGEFRQGHDFLSSMATELIRLGFAPDALKDSKSELTATKYHLEDMRSLVFK